MERFINELISKLCDKVNEDDLEVIKDVLYRTLDNYEVTYKETSITPYRGELPKEVKEYLVSKKIEGLSDGSLKTYYYALRQFFSYALKCPADIKTNDIRQYLYMQSTRKLKGKSLDGMRVIINSFFEWLVVNDYLIKNPCKKLGVIRDETIIQQPLSDIEMEKIRGVCETPLEKCIVEVLYSTGCRVSELVGIKVNDINVTKREIKVYGKGKKERITYVNARAMLALSNYLSAKNYVSDYVFTSQRSPHQQLTTRRIEIIVKNLGVKAGIQTRVYPHRIRRTTATDALTRGMQLEQVQSLLGHESPRTTLIYAQVIKDDVKYSHQKAII